MNANPARRAAAVATSVAALVMTITVIFAAPAWAHAELVTTTPTPGAVLTADPGQVVLTFSEPVATSYGGGIRVVGPDGRNVTVGTAAVRGAAVVSALPGTLSAGTYQVSWRVVSDDGHPVSGGFSFSIGHPSTTLVVVPTGGDRLTGLVFGAFRFLGFVGLILLVGGLAFTVAVGRLVVRGRVSRLLTAGWLISAVGSAAELLAYGPYAAGRALSAVGDPRLLYDDLGTTYGRAHMVRFAMLALIGAALAELRPEPSVGSGVVTTGRATRPTVEIRNGENRLPSWPVLLLLGLASVTFLGTWSVSGHAGAGSWRGYAVVNDSLHLAAISTWLGGLVFVLAVGLRLGPADRDVVLARWSRVAFGAVVVLVASGTYASWRQVRHLSNVTTTPYGRILLVKVGIVAVMVGLGALSRRWVRRRSGSERNFRRGVLAEVGLSVAVLTLTAVLVESAPARLGPPHPIPTVAPATLTH